MSKLTKLPAGIKKDRSFLIRRADCNLVKMEGGRVVLVAITHKTDGSKKSLSFTIFREVSIAREPIRNRYGYKLHKLDKKKLPEDDEYGKSGGGKTLAGILLNAQKKGVLLRTETEAIEKCFLYCFTKEDVSKVLSPIYNEVEIISEEDDILEEDFLNDGNTENDKEKLAL